MAETNEKPVEVAGAMMRGPWSIGAGAVVVDNERVLLVRNLYGVTRERYLLPAGRVKPGEMPDRTAERETLEEISSRLREAGDPLGLVEVDEPTFDLLRIEAGTPIFGRDITSRNLPQEVGRDSRAISFVKGCYLGQETVARIDALGHVNQLLCGIRLEPGALGPLEVGGTLKQDGKNLATLTSVAYSPGWGTWIGLGYVRTAALENREPLDALDASGNPVGVAVISELPMIPPGRG